MLHGRVVVALAVENLGIRIAYRSAASSGAPYVLKLYSYIFIVQGHLLLLASSMVVLRDNSDAVAGPIRHDLIRASFPTVHVCI